MAQVMTGHDLNIAGTAVPRADRPSWNPLCCEGTALPANLLLWAKIAGMLLIGMGYVGKMPEPWLPLLGFPYGLPAITKEILQGITLAAIGLLLFNRWVRTCCIAIALAQLAGMLLDRLYWSNAQTFVMLMWLLIGLYAGPITHTLIRWQYAVMYLGAGINKLEQKDWHSGQFFNYWMTEVHRSPIFTTVADALPPLVGGKLFSWTAIVVELSLAVLLLVPRKACWLIAIVVIFGFHGMSVIMCDTLFIIYLPTLALGCFTFFVWPRKQEVLITAPAESGLAKWLGRLDWDRLLVIREGKDWQTQSPDGLAPGRLARLRGVIYLPMFWWTLCFGAAFTWSAYLKLRSMI